MTFPGLYVLLSLSGETLLAFQGSAKIRHPYNFSISHLHPVDSSLPSLLKYLESPPLLEHLQCSHNYVSFSPPLDYEISGVGTMSFFLYTFCALFFQ